MIGAIDPAKAPDAAPVIGKADDGVLPVPEGPRTKLAASVLPRTAAVANAAGFIALKLTAISYRSDFSVILVIRSSRRRRGRSHAVAR